MEEAPENGKELSHSALANGMNECVRWSLCFKMLFQIQYMLSWSLIVRDVTPCGLVDMYRCFRVTCSSTVYPDSNTFLHNTGRPHGSVYSEDSILQEICDELSTWSFPKVSKLLNFSLTFFSIA